MTSRDVAETRTIDNTCDVASLKQEEFCDVTQENVTPKKVLGFLAARVLELQVEPMPVVTVLSFVWRRH